MKKLVVYLIALWLVIFPYNEFTYAGEYLSSDDIYELGDELLKGYFQDGNMYDELFCQMAGSSVGDWMIIGASQMGLIEENPLYVNNLKKVVDHIYSKELSLTKATEFQRISITLMALKQDPSDFCGHDLICDGSYNRGTYQTLEKQGINSWCFALISQTLAEYNEKGDEFYSVDDMINRILEHQLGNGAFAMTGMGADADITAMAIQSLSKYTDRADVSKAISAALTYLSDTQKADGDFSSLGNDNCESTAQVIIALTCLGIDPQTDYRFIKNGNSVVDGLLKYKTAEGTFCHIIKDGDKKPNALATAQGLCAIASLYRYEVCGSSLYDISEELLPIETTAVAEESSISTTAPSDTEIKEEYTTSESTAQSEENDGLSEYPADEDNRPGEGFVYIIAAFVVFVGMFCFVIMKKKGRE